MKLSVRLDEDPDEDIIIEGDDSIETARLLRSSSLILFRDLLAIFVLYSGIIDLFLSLSDGFT